MLQDLQSYPGARQDQAHQQAASYAGAGSCGESPLLPMSFVKFMLRSELKGDSGCRSLTTKQMQLPCMMQ